MKSSKELEEVFQEILKLYDNKDKMSMLWDIYVMGFCEGQKEYYNYVVNPIKGSGQGIG